MLCARVQQRAVAPQRASRRSTVVVQAKKNTVAESYASALVTLADEKNKLEAVHADVDAVSALMTKDK